MLGKAAVRTSTPTIRVQKVLDQKRTRTILAARREWRAYDFPSRKDVDFLANRCWTRRRQRAVFAKLILLSLAGEEIPDDLGMVLAVPQLCEGMLIDVT